MYKQVFSFIVVYKHLSMKNTKYDTHAYAYLTQKKRSGAHSRSIMDMPR